MVVVPPGVDVLVLKLVVVVVGVVVPTLVVVVAGGVVVLLATATEVVTVLEVLEVSVPLSWVVVARESSFAVVVAVAVDQNEMTIASNRISFPCSSSPFFCFCLYSKYFCPRLFFLLLVPSASVCRLYWF